MAVVPRHDIGIGKMLVVSVKILLTHFQSVEDMNSRAPHTDIVFKGSYQIGVELVVNALFRCKAYACEQLLKGLDILFSLFGVLCLFEHHICHPLGQLAVMGSLTEHRLDYG